MLSLEWSGKTGSLLLVTPPELLACPDMNQPSQSSQGLLLFFRQARESKEALDLAKAKEAAAEAKDKEANSKLAGLLAREQAVADYKDQHAAALQAKDAADQVCFAHAAMCCPS
jgi:hypothetical protein